MKFIHYVFAISVAGILVFGFLGMTAFAESKHQHTGKWTQTAGDLTVSLTLDPAHPMAGKRTRAAVQFVHAETSAPVAVEDVKINWAMPDMGHDVETRRKVPGREKGAFTSTVNFPMGGDYEATVTGIHAGKDLEVSLRFHVGKDEGESGEHDGHGHHGHGH